MFRKRQKKAIADIEKITKLLLAIASVISALAVLIKAIKS